VSVQEGTNDGTQVVKAISWNFIATGANQLANLLRVVVTARVIAPAEFGVFGMTMIVYAGLAAFSDLGTKAAFLSQNSENEQEQRDWLDTQWSMDVVIKGALAVALAASAYPASWYFREPRVAPIIVVLGLSPLIRSFSNPAMLLLEKKIEFRRIAYYEVGTGIASAVITALAAWYLRSAWALVVGHVGGSLLSVAITYVVEPGRARFRIVRGPFRASLVFAKAMLMLNGLNFLAGRFDNLVIARRLGAVALGAYGVANRLIEIPVGIITYEVGRVLFPYYAQAAGRGEAALVIAFQKSSGYIMWALFALFIPLFMYADLVVPLLFGPNWDAAIPVARVIAVSGIVRGASRALGTLLQALQLPNLDARGTFAEVAALVPTCLFAIPLAGAVGAAWAVVVSFCVGAIFRFWLVQQRLGQSLGRLLLVARKPSLAAVVGIATAEGVQLATANRWFGLAVYCAAFAVFALVLERELREMLQKAWSRSRA
jgi:lipopolysaccharide exporter